MVEEAFWTAFVMWGIPLIVLSALCITSFIISERRSENEHKTGSRKPYGPGQSLE